MSARAKPAGGLVSFLTGLVYLAAFCLFSLGLINYQTQSVTGLFRRLLGLDVPAVEYRVNIDYAPLVENQCRMIAHLETLEFSGFVNPVVTYECPGPLGIPVRTDQQFGMRYTAHIGFDLTDPASYSLDYRQIEDSVTISLALPEPEILALEIPEGAIRDFYIDTDWFAPAGTRLAIDTEKFPEVMRAADSLARIEVEAGPAVFQQAREDLEAELREYLEEQLVGRVVDVRISFDEGGRTAPLSRGDDGRDPGE